MQENFVVMYVYWVRLGLDHRFLLGVRCPLSQFLLTKEADWLVRFGPRQKMESLPSTKEMIHDLKI